MSQRFDVLELPEPSIYFEYSIKDTINLGDKNNLSPQVSHFLDKYTRDDYLKYKLLAYHYTIKTEKSTECFKIKSERGNKAFLDRIGRIRNGNHIILDNIYVLYPDNSVRRLKRKVFVVAK